MLVCLSFFLLGAYIILFPLICNGIFGPEHSDEIFGLTSFGRGMGSLATVFVIFVLGSGDIGLRPDFSSYCLSMIFPTLLALVLLAFYRPTYNWEEEYNSHEKKRDMQMKKSQMKF